MERGSRVVTQALEKESDGIDEEEFLRRLLIGEFCLKRLHLAYAPLKRSIRIMFVKTPRR